LGDYPVNAGIFWRFHHDAMNFIVNDLINIV